MKKRHRGVSKPATRPASIPPNTTEQQNLTVEGQRKVNLIWEYTQAFIAILVIISNMIAGLYYAFTGNEGGVPSVLSSCLFLVIGFYFSRTNHQAIGGIGEKPLQKYQGR